MVYDNPHITGAYHPPNIQQKTCSNLQFKVKGNFHGPPPNSGIPFLYWLVVSTHVKNISQIGSFPQIGMKLKSIRNHHLVYYTHTTKLPFKYGSTAPQTWEGGGPGPTIWGPGKIPNLVDIYPIGIQTPPDFS